MDRVGAGGRKRVGSYGMEITLHARSASFAFAICASPDLHTEIVHRNHCLNPQPNLHRTLDPTSQRSEEGPTLESLKLNDPPVGTAGQQPNHSR